MRLIPYLMMNGNAKDAIEYYTQVMDAKVEFQQTFGDMPANPAMPTMPEVKDLVMHAMVKIGDSDLMFSDTFPDQPTKSGDQVTICVSIADAEQAKKMFETLKQEGQEIMPLQETFFSPAYGIVTDKFGVTFQIYAESQKN
jgi:PhnB protein